MFVLYLFKLVKNWSKHFPSCFQFINTNEQIMISSVLFMFVIVCLFMLLLLLFVIV